MSAVWSIMMPLNTSGPLANKSGKLAQLTGQPAASQSGSDGNRNRDDAVALLEELLRERDMIIARHERVMRDRTKQLDVLCEELARVAAHLGEQQAALDDRAERLEQSEQSSAKYKTWLSGYDANLIYLEEQITDRDQIIQELQTEVARLSETVKRPA